MIDWFKKLFKKRESLRDKCVDVYDEEFGEMYDSLNSGISIGGFLETTEFLDMIEAVKQEKPYALKHIPKKK